MPLPDVANALNPPGQGPLRPGGVPVSDPLSADASLPSKLSKAASRQAASVAICRDCWGGPARMREVGRTYLPQEVGEKPMDYDVRLQRSVFVGFFAHAVKSLVGFVFRKDPVLGDDVPAPIKAQWENLDNAGTHGDVFAAQLLQDDLIDGHCAIHVEYPDVGATPPTRGEEAARGIRPYWIPIRKENMLSWRTTVEDGRTVLTQVVLKECTTEPVGSYGEHEVERYRVLYRANGVVGWRVERVVNNAIVVDGEGVYTTQDEIPIAEVVSAGKVSLFESEPPLLDLAYLNIAHYQQLSDDIISRHKTSVPVLFGAGIMEQIDPTTGEKIPLKIGPNTAILTADPNAKLTYVAHDGAALAGCKAALDDLKSDMGALSLAMLAPQKRAAETAEAKKIDKGASDSALARTARGVQDGIERALYFHARYLNLADGGSVTINRDYEDAILDAATMQAYADLAVKLHVDPAIILRQLQLGGRIADDVDVEAEAEKMQARADAEAEAKAQAEQDRLQQQLELQAARAGGRLQPAGVAA